MNSEFIRILVFENQIEASLMESHLKERKIPHVIRSYQDYAYNGIFQTQKGWGHVEAPEEYADEIKAIYTDLMEKET